MTDIQIFNNEQFGEIRTVVNESGDPLFCASDVAKALGYARPADAVADHCKGVSILPTPTNGGVQQVKFIKEADVYRLVMKSKAPNAEMFQDWVCEEVLPSIRKHGGYLVTKSEDTPEMIMARAVLVAQATIEKQSKLLAEKEAKIEADAPKVLFAEAVETSDSVCLVGELAKILKQNGVTNMGQNRLYKWLRSHCYLGNKGDNYNLPTQKAMNLGVFKVIKGRRIDRHTGGVVVTRTAKVTTKGLKYFINKFINTAAVL